MRSFTQFCRKCIAVSILLPALASYALAGDMQYPGLTIAPPATTNGEIQNPGTAYPLTEIALSLLQSALLLS